MHLKNLVTKKRDIINEKKFNQIFMQTKKHSRS